MEFRTGLEDKPWWVAALLGLILAGVIYFAGNHYLLKPRQENLAQLDGKLLQLQAKIQEGRAAKAQLPQFRQEVQRLELELDKLLRVLPARRNTPELLRRIRDLTEQGDFDLMRFTPGNFVDQEFFSEWPIAVSLNGTYHNLALLFDRVSRFSRIINIEGLKVSEVKNNAGPGHTITASFTAKTFVYKEPEPPTEEEGEAAAAAQ
jgi:type IV pilus assembly protein PilO